MRQKNLTCLFLILTFSLMSCSNKYKLEEKSILEFKESYYQQWVAGVKGGGAGFSIFLELKPEIKLDRNELKVEGIYFKKRYASLDYFSPAKFRGFIRTERSTVSNTSKKLGDDDLDEVPKRTQEEDIPFVLTDNEAVIVYKEKGVRKYVKVLLEKKDLLNPPM